MKMMDLLKQNQNITVRRASFEDAPTILNLWQGSARWLLNKGIKQWDPEEFTLEHVFAFMNNGSHVYVAVVNDIPVGTYVITWSDPVIWKELDNNESGYIHRFAVNREFPGNHIGKYLLETAEQQIRAMGKTYIRLDCMADNSRLNQYYRDNGYEFIRRNDWDRWSANLYQKK